MALLVILCHLMLELHKQIDTVLVASPIADSHIGSPLSCIPLSLSSSQLNANDCNLPWDTKPDSMFFSFFQYQYVSIQLDDD